MARVCDQLDPQHSDYYVLDSVQLNTGDTLKVDTSHWGESALDEMCLMSFSVYPALPYGNPFIGLRSVHALQFHVPRSHSHTRRPPERKATRGDVRCQSACLVGRALPSH